jgi:hypothetical protein
MLVVFQTAHCIFETTDCIPTEFGVWDLNYTKCYPANLILVHIGQI